MLIYLISNIMEKFSPFKCFPTRRNDRCLSSIYSFFVHFDKTDIKIILNQISIPKLYFMYLASTKKKYSLKNTLLKC